MILLSYRRWNYCCSRKNIPLIEQAVSSANWKLLSRLRSGARQLQAFTGHFLLAEKKSSSENYDPHFT